MVPRENNSSDLNRKENWEFIKSAEDDSRIDVRGTVNAETLELLEEHVSLPQRPENTSNDVNLRALSDALKELEASGSEKEKTKAGLPQGQDQTSEKNYRKDDKSMSSDNIIQKALMDALTEAECSETGKEEASLGVSHQPTEDNYNKDNASSDVTLAALADAVKEIEDIIEGCAGIPQGQLQIIGDSYNEDSECNNASPSVNLEALADAVRQVEVSEIGCEEKESAVNKQIKRISPQSNVSASAKGQIQGTRTTKHKVDPEKTEDVEREKLLEYNMQTSTQSSVSASSNEEIQGTKTVKQKVDPQETEKIERGKLLEDINKYKNTITRNPFAKKYRGQLPREFYFTEEQRILFTKVMKEIRASKKEKLKQKKGTPEISKEKLLYLRDVVKERAIQLTKWSIQQQIFRDEKTLTYNRKEPSSMSMSEDSLWPSIPNKSLSELPQLRRANSCVLSGSNLSLNLTEILSVCEGKNQVTESISTNNSITDDLNLQEDLVRLLKAAVIAFMIFDSDKEGSGYNQEQETGKGTTPQKSWMSNIKRLTSGLDAEKKFNLVLRQRKRRIHKLLCEIITESFKEKEKFENHPLINNLMNCLHDYVVMKIPKIMKETFQVDQPDEVTRQKFSEKLDQTLTEIIEPFVIGAFSQVRDRSASEIDSVNMNTFSNLLQQLKQKEEKSEIYKRRLLHLEEAMKTRAMLITQLNIPQQAVVDKKTSIKTRKKNSSKKSSSDDCPKRSVTDIRLPGSAPVQSEIQLPPNAVVYFEVPQASTLIYQVTESNTTTYIDNNNYADYLILQKLLVRRLQTMVVTLTVHASETSEVENNQKSWLASIGSFMAKLIEEKQFEIQFQQQKRWIHQMLCEIITHTIEKKEKYQNHPLTEKLLKYFKVYIVMNSPEILNEKFDPNLTEIIDSVVNAAFNQLRITPANKTDPVNTVKSQDSQQKAMSAEQTSKHSGKKALPKKSPFKDCSKPSVSKKHMPGLAQQRSERSLLIPQVHRVTESKDNDNQNADVANLHKEIVRLLKAVAIELRIFDLDNEEVVNKQQGIEKEMIHLLQESIKETGNTNKSLKAIVNKFVDKLGGNVDLSEKLVRKRVHELLCEIIAQCLERKHMFEDHPQTPTLLKHFQAYVLMKRPGITDKKLYPKADEVIKSLVNDAFTQVRNRAASKVVVMNTGQFQYFFDEKQQSLSNVQQKMMATGVNPVSLGTTQKLEKTEIQQQTNKTLYFVVEEFSSVQLESTNMTESVKDASSMRESRADTGSEPSASSTGSLKTGDEKSSSNSVLRQHKTGCIKKERSKK